MSDRQSNESQNHCDSVKTSPAEIRARVRLDEICLSFESNWTPDSVKDIEKFAEQIDGEYKSALVCELLAIDFEMRQSLNTQVSLDQYVPQIPNYSKEISSSIQYWLDQTRASASLTGTKPSMPKQMGDYRIVKLIGEGGTGAVYEAVQESLDRTVAIKTLHHPHVASQVSRFQLEARTVALLHHTNIVEVYGSGIDQGVPYFAMQLVEGHGLDKLIDQSLAVAPNSIEQSHDFLQGDQGQRNIANIGLQVSRALAHAHQLGVLHRDIKPSNLLIDHQGNTWVSDFGLAKLRNEDSNNTLDGSVVGTMRYIPPEAFSGEWSERGDIYSLGATLYELATLKPAFSAEDHPQLIKLITSGDQPITPIHQTQPGISKDLETIITKALSFDPNNRYNTAGEMANELDLHLKGMPIVSRPIPTSEKVWRWAKRKPTSAALAALICAVAFIGLPIAIWLWLRASSALEIAEDQRNQATQLQVLAEESQHDADASRYGSATLLASSYMEDGRTSDAKRIIDELYLAPHNSSDRTTYSDTWELDYLRQNLDTSRLTLQGDKRFKVWHVAIRPDEKQIATVHCGDLANSKLPGEVILWDSESGQIEQRLQGHGSPVFGCAYSNDGKLLATIGFKIDHEKNQLRRGSICTWDVLTGERLSSIELEGEFNRRSLDALGTVVLPGVMFSDDDKHLVCWPNTIEVIDRNTKISLWKTDGRCAKVMPDNRLLVYTGYSLFNCDLLSGKKSNSVDKQQHNFANFEFSLDRKMLACKAQDRLRIWDSVQALDQHRDISIPGISWAELSPDGTEFAYNTRKGEIKIQPIEPSDTRALRSLLGHQSTVTSGDYSANGSWLVTGSVDGTAKIWDMAKRNLKLDTQKLHDKIASISFADDGSSIIYCARKTIAPSKNLFSVGKLGLDGQMVSQVNADVTYCANWPRNDFSFTRDGKWLAAPIAEPEYPTVLIGNSKSSGIGIWDSQQWDKWQTIETQFSEIIVTGWSTDNRILAVGGIENDVQKIRLYLVEGKTATKLGEVSPNGNISSLALHQLERLVVSTSEGIQIWNLSKKGRLENGTTKLTFGKPTTIALKGERVSLDISPDGSRLACADFTNDLLLVFDLNTTRLCYQRSGPRRFCSVRFSPCGKRLALSGYDSIVHLCDAEYGYCLLLLRAFNASPGTTSISSKVVFSPDGRRIATNNWQGKIAFWEIEKNEESD